MCEYRQVSPSRSAGTTAATAPIFLPPGWANALSDLQPKSSCPTCSVVMRPLRQPNRPHTPLPPLVPWWGPGRAPQSKSGYPMYHKYSQVTYQVVEPMSLGRGPAPPKYRTCHPLRLHEVCVCFVLVSLSFSLFFSFPLVSLDGRESSELDIFNCLPFSFRT